MAIFILLGFYLLEVLINVKNKKKIKELQTIIDEQKLKDTIDNL